MDTDTGSLVVTEATVENLRDLWDARRGLIPPGRVRRVAVNDAVVQPSTAMVALPTRLIRQLGLDGGCQKRVMHGTGFGEAPMYEAVRLTIRGRDCTTDVLEVPDDVPVLIGRLALLQLDLVVDARRRRLVGNPAHGGEQMFELF